MNWKKKLNEHKELRKQGAVLLHARVTLLVAVYDDEAFREWCEVNETDEIEYLDEQLSDVAVEFMTLRTVLQEFPKAEEWAERNIRELIAEVLEAKRRKRGESTERISWKERALAAEKECEQLRTELAAQGARIDELHNVIGLMKPGDAKTAAAA